MVQVPFSVVYPFLGTHQQCTCIGDESPSKKGWKISPKKRMKRSSSAFCILLKILLLDSTESRKHWMTVSSFFRFRYIWSYGEYFHNQIKKNTLKNFPFYLRWRLNFLLCTHFDKMDNLMQEEKFNLGLTTWNFLLFILLIQNVTGFIFS